LSCTVEGFDGDVQVDVDAPGTLEARTSPQLTFEYADGSRDSGFFAGGLPGPGLAVIGSDDVLFIVASGTDATELGGPECIVGQWSVFTDERGSNTTHVEFATSGGKAIRAEVPVESKVPVIIPLIESDS
jgi:hypothetical protein